VEIEDQKDTISVLKKLNEKQKAVIEREKERMREKEGIIGRLNGEIVELSGENKILGQEVSNSEQVIRSK
jgi:hypothetical protein